MTFGEWLRREREKRGWNVSQLADKTGVSQPLLSMYEKGTRNPKRETILQITRQLDINSELPLALAGFASETMTPPTTIEYPFGRLILPNGGDMGLTEQELLVLLGYYKALGMEQQALQVSEALASVRGEKDKEDGTEGSVDIGTGGGMSKPSRS